MMILSTKSCDDQTFCSSYSCSTRILKIHVNTPETRLAKAILCHSLTLATKLLSCVLCYCGGGGGGKAAAAGKSRKEACRAGGQVKGYGKFRPKWPESKFAAAARNPLFFSFLVQRGRFERGLRRCGCCYGCCYSGCSDYGGCGRRCETLRYRICSLAVL